MVSLPLPGDSLSLVALHWSFARRTGMVPAARTESGEWSELDHTVVATIAAGGGQGTDRCGEWLEGIVD